MSSEELVFDEDVIDASASRAQLTEACRVDLNFLAALILQEIYEYEYPKLFLSIWQWICSAAEQAKGKPKYAIGIPRGFSKTILLKLYVVWLVLFSNRNFVLIVCNTQTHANNFIADVVDMLDNINIVRIFGSWRAGVNKTTDVDRQDLKRFSFRGKDMIIAAIGSGGSPRGLNIKFRRPDIVLMDDMQNRDEASNLEIAEEQLVWMLGTLMKACHPKRCVFIFVGNMYPFEGSILRKLKHNSEWTSWITGAITADGKSIWPAHRDIEDLLAELATDESAGHPEIFYAEVMNDEEGGTVSGIDVGKIQFCPAGITPEMAQGGAVIIDPALKKRTSDATGMGVMLVFDEVPVLWETVTESLDPAQTIERATMLAHKYGLQLVVVESVAYQSTLCFWFDRVWKQYGITGMHVGEIFTEGLAKNARISDWLRKLLSGANVLGPEARNPVIYQITQWNPLKTKNVDELLDIGAYMDKVCQMHKEYLPRLVLANLSRPENKAAHTEDLSLPF